MPLTKKITYLILFLSIPFWLFLSASLNHLIFSLVTNAQPLLMPLDKLHVLSAYSTGGAVLIAIIMLGVELFFVNYKDSAICRIWTGDLSAEVDLFHAFLYASNLKNILGIFFSFGIAHLCHNLIIENFSFNLLSNKSFIFQFASLCFVNSFLFYWTHRFLHSRWLWPIHQVHHSATSMNLITNFRNHPLNVLVEVTLYSLSSALLGASFEATIAYLVLNGFYQLTAHSNFVWNLRDTRLGFLQNWLLVAPEEHRLHHSKEERYWYCNYGLTPLWDRVFGTWKPNLETKPVAIGLEILNDQANLSTFRASLQIACAFYKNLWSNFFR